MSSLGQTIDIFHKNPAHQRQLLPDPKNLPHRARITIGGEILDLLVTAICDQGGRYIAPMLTWSLVTEQVKAETQTERLLQMLDNMPINVMMCDNDFNIAYVNKTSVTTLTPLQKLCCPYPLASWWGNRSNISQEPGPSAAVASRPGKSAAPGQNQAADPKRSICGPLRYSIRADNIPDRC